MLIFFRRRSASPPPAPPPVEAVTEIIVRESASFGREDYDLPTGVVMFVNDMLEAFYLPEELPREAMVAYYLDYYVAQVNNGGHGQFAGNSGWKPEVNALIREGLERLGLDDAAAIFADFERFAEQEPERFAAAAEACGFDGTAEITSEFDDRFYAGPTKSITAANSAWLRGLANLRAVPDDLYAAEIEALAALNTQRQAREAEAKRLAAERRAADPLIQAMIYLAERADPPLEFLHWRAGHPYESGGHKGTRFGVATSGGSAMIYFFPHIAMLWINGAEDPAVRLPFETVERHVRRKTRQSLSKAVFDL